MLILKLYSLTLLGLWVFLNVYNMLKESNPVKVYCNIFLIAITLPMIYFLINI